MGGHLLVQGAPVPCPWASWLTLGAPMAWRSSLQLLQGLPEVLSQEREARCTQLPLILSLKPPAQLQRGTQGSLWRTSPEASFPLEPSRSPSLLQPLPAQIAFSCPSHTQLPYPEFLDPGAGCPLLWVKRA